MLDVDHGTYPFVTSPTCVAGARRRAQGSVATAIGHVLGISKAYTTRVGSGPFPTELTDDIGRGLRERGDEFGTATGRPRRCGWFDAVMVRQAIRVGGIRGIALTKLDVLDGLAELKIAVGYRRGKETLNDFPAVFSPARRRDRAGLRDHTGLAREHPGCPVLGASCRRPRSSISAGSRN